MLLMIFFKNSINEKRERVIFGGGIVFVCQHKSSQKNHAVQYPAQQSDTLFCRLQKLYRGKMAVKRNLLRTFAPELPENTI
ncbi:MAG: hypothetical protein HUK14_11610 [Muribaculaceae bacterium]|nr:hypothetical protein [Muribaculaceae bacterium]